jgi:hypothetical protein
MAVNGLVPGKNASTARFRKWPAAKLEWLYTQLISTTLGANVSRVFALALLAVSSASPSAIRIAQPTSSPASQPVFLEIPKGAQGLTLYNNQGGVVVRCDRSGDSFNHCQMEPGVTLDDVMNAWAHAYQQIEK